MPRLSTLLHLQVFIRDFFLQICYNTRMDKNCFDQIYMLARQIPYGRVTTYGSLARMCGNPRLSRVVGCAMHSAPQDVPCHRVVNRRGELCAAFSPCGRETHRLLLEAEGVPFLPNGRVDLGAVLWPDTIL